MIKREKSLKFPKNLRNSPKIPPKKPENLPTGEGVFQKFSMTGGYFGYTPLHTSLLEPYK